MWMVTAAEMHRGHDITHGEEPHSLEQSHPDASFNLGQRLLAEFVATFFLVLGSAGAIVVDTVSHGQIGRAASVVVPGLMVMAAILFMGKLSGAHLNPVVTFAFALRRDFPWRRVPGYVAVQLLGAISACTFLLSMFGKVGELGATVPASGLSNHAALLMEAVLTTGLVSVVLGTASSAQNVGGLSAVAVGGYIALAGLWASPITGSSMNPARSLGPEIVMRDLGSAWLYVTGPLLGSLLAVGVAQLLRGSGGDRIARQTAEGLPSTQTSRRLRATRSAH
jgi:aquaporin Z